MSMAECPFIPPYPVPPARKPGLLGRFVLGWGSWVHTLFAGAYTMKLGHTRLPRLSVFMVNELSLVRRVLGGAIFPSMICWPTCWAPWWAAVCFPPMGRSGGVSAPW
jgi:hypothetical protein